LRKIKEEKNLRLDKELENILNDDANAWLLEQWPEKSKCALAFDEGDSRYGIMTTNISEVFNFVLKGIRALLVSGIVDYISHKCNEYFVNRWKKARQSMTKGERWGEPVRKHLLEQCEISTNEVAVLFDSMKLVYDLSYGKRRIY
jgi:hypothetical protein